LQLLCIILEPFLSCFILLSLDSLCCLYGCVLGLSIPKRLVEDLTILLPSSSQSPGNKKRHRQKGLRKSSGFEATGALREREREREREMAAIRSPAMAPAFVEGLVSSKLHLQRLKFRSSDVFGTSTGLNRSKGLQRALRLDVVEEEDRGKQARARSMAGPPDNNLPANHKIKAASLKAFEELRNASANRKHVSSISLLSFFPS
jgi:hypothetical protein